MRTRPMPSSIGWYVADVETDSAAYSKELHVALIERTLQHYEDKLSGPNWGSSIEVTEKGLSFKMMEVSLSSAEVNSIWAEYRAWVENYTVNGSRAFNWVDKKIKTEPYGPWMKKNKGSGLKEVGAYWVYYGARHLRHQDFFQN